MIDLNSILQKHKVFGSQNEPFTDQTIF